jgi:hypothetical protein
MGQKKKFKLFAVAAATANVLSCWIFPFIILDWLLCKLDVNECKQIFSAMSSRYCEAADSDQYNLINLQIGISALTT